MAITINGSGTISGISSGGLNDGIITPAELSTGSPSWDSSGNLSFNSGYGSTAVAYGCRAWVNFNGTGTVAIRASANVSSITDNATGEYTLNFTNAMPDTNYIVTGNQRIAGGYSLLYPAFTEVPPTTTTAKIYTGSTNLGGNVDPPYVFVSVFR
jgi:hypothetical protein